MIITIRPKTKAEQIEKLKAEYEPLFYELHMAWVAANVQGDLDSVNEDIATLKTEYTAKMEAINIG